MIKANLKARQIGDDVLNNFVAVQYNRGRRPRAIVRVGLKKVRQLLKMLKAQKVKFDVSRVSFSNIVINY